VPIRPRSRSMFTKSAARMLGEIRIDIPTA
jgi:hypothetical protein